MHKTVGLLGKKVGMTQIFDSEGAAVPVTVIALGENIVTQKLTDEKHGYTAVQIGGFVVKEKKLNKPQMGGLKKQNLPPLKPLKEYRIDDHSKLPEVGQPLKADEVVKEGMLVDVQGHSIGKGFQGRVKRHNGHRGSMTHGSKNHRLQGSIGQHSDPGRVFPGLKMAGHMGSETTTTRHVVVIKVDPEKRVLLIKGAVPGHDGGLVCIRPSITKWNPPKPNKK